MRILVWAYIFLFCQSIVSQDITYDVGTTWTYNQFVFGPMGDHYVRFRIDKDTIIKEQLFYLINEHDIVQTNDSISNQIVRQHYLRFSDQQILYFHPKADTILYLYDFNLTQGTTYDMALGDFPWHEEALTVPIVIDSVGEILIENKVWQVQYTSSPMEEYSYYSIINGIGRNGYLFPTSGTVDPPLGGSLACFDNGLNYYPSEKSCDLILDNNKVSLIFTHIYPNPSRGIIHINSDIPINRITLLDLQGNILVTEVGSGAKIDVSSFYQGLYLLRLDYKNGQQSMKKIVISP